VKAAPKPPRRPASPPRRTAIALFLLCLACYLANGRTTPFESSGDTVPNRLLPFSILAFHTLTLDPFAGDFAARGGYRWYVVERQGHLISFYPLGSAFLALPLYLPAWAVLAASGHGDHTSLFLASAWMEKLAASLQAALTVAIFYLVMRRLIPGRPAFWTALAFGLGTSIWATVSQSLWQHGAVALGLTAGIWFLTWPGRPAWSAPLAGLALGFGVASRPSAILFWVAGLGALLLTAEPWRERLRRAAGYMAAGLPLILFSPLYNLYWYGSLLGGYQEAGNNIHLMSYAALGAPGLLVSPNRGLFVFTPIALVGVVGLIRAFRRFREEPLLPLLGLAAAAHFLLIASYPEWAGGWSFGPRYLTDVLPILGMAGGLELPHLPRRVRPLVATALVWSILVQWNGAFCYPASRWAPLTRGSLEKAAWDWRRFELWKDFQAWRQGGPLAAPL
jgi:hypothetical protein